MREILFRGKMADNGEWINGYYIVAAGMPFMSIFGKREPMLVLPETVGQFTGLLDKNGKRVFEGDICFSGTNPCEVVFHEGEFMLKGHKIKKITSLKKYVNYIEIIGNIHDNTDLLEVRK